MKEKNEKHSSKKVFEENQILIRKYKKSDYQATLEILKQLHNIFNITLKEDQWRASSGLRIFKPNLKRITLVAEQKLTSEVVGMGIIEVSKNPLGQYIGYLDNWAIKKEFIGKQVGRILANKAIRILKSWGCESIRINLSYGAPQKLLKVFGYIGFKPIITVLEKRI
ncbi:MAG: GNAT family N-acetyltransferase [Promethearchaeota archaeon]